jgi:hypothetical protein
VTKSTLSYYIFHRRAAISLQNIRKCCRLLSGTREHCHLRLRIIQHLIFRASHFSLTFYWKRREDVFPLLLLLLLLLWLYSPLLGLGHFFSFLIVYTVGRTPWTGDQSGRYLRTEQHKHRINAHNTHINALSRIRTHDPSVRASEDSSRLRAATVIGVSFHYPCIKR